MSKAGGWAVIAGALLMFVGLCFLPAAFGAHADPTMLAGGLSLFSFGSLTLSGGIYMKASALQTASGGAPKAQPKKVRGGCDLCGLEVPAIHCRVHGVHLCADCVSAHYDFRSCAYVPSTRRSTPAKAAARFAANA
jgi:hypothetical protein